jgi:hypothetical protein
LLDRGKDAMQKRIIVSVAIFSLALMMLTAVPKLNASNTVIHVAPPAISDAVVGQDYTVNINVTDVADLYAWEFQLSYDPTILSVTSTSIVDGGLNTPTHTYQNVTDNVNGQLWLALSSIHPATGITYPEHAILEIVFHAISAEICNLHLSGTILSDSTGTAISHTDADGTITVSTRDLTVTSITVDTHGCQIYKDDTCKDGSTYYYPVEVKIHNTGTLDAGFFSVELEVYAHNGSSIEATQEINVTADLGAGLDTTVNFTSLLHPTKTGLYRLTATVDSQNDVIEDNEANNVLVMDNVPVTVIGDINGNGAVNILDGVVISQAFYAYPTDLWWNIKADLNHDGVVDVYDAIRIGIYWGDTS